MFTHPTPNTARDSFEQVTSQIPEPTRVIIRVGTRAVFVCFWQRLGGGAAVAAFVVCLLGGLCKPALALNVAVDIDTTRKSATDTSGTVTTQSGYTSWNLTNVGTSGSTITLSGITFEIFGLASANQSRIRPAGNGTSLDALTTDFVFNDGGGAGVGLRITGLPIGTFNMQSWHYDSTLTNTNEFIQVEIRNQGQSSPPPVVDNFAFSNSPASFQVPVTAAGQVKELVFREDSANNRARLNGFTLTSPAPPPELTLEVNTTSGALRIVNEQGTSFDINYYEIRSTNGSLRPTGWVSFDDTDGGADPVGSGWDEAPASDAHLLNEVNLNSMVTFAPGDVASFGSAFMVTGVQDLEFKYAGPNDTNLRDGVVKYVSNAAGLAGDYNNNGVVDAADYVLWRKGGPLQNEGRTTGVVDQQDYNFWRARFGETASSGSGSSLGGGSAVPEPVTLTFFAVAMVLFSVQHRQRAPRA
jgi:hypothetical protein